MNKSEMKRYLKEQIKWIEDQGTDNDDYRCGMWAAYKDMLTKLETK